MLQQEQTTEENIQRSLDRIKIFMERDLTQAIPAFSYTANILLEYAQKKGIKHVNYKYFCEFKEDLEVFMKKDFSELKKHQKDIINQILQTVDTQLFIECLKPQIQTSRISLLDDQQKNEDYIQRSQQNQIQLAESISKETMNEHQKDTKTVKQHNYNTSPSQNSGEIQQAYQQLVIAYKQHRIDEAYERKNKFIEKYPKQIGKQKEQFFKTIDLEYTTMIGFYKQFDLQGWVLDKIQNGVKLEYKLFQEQKQIAIRIQSQFNVSIQNFLAILCEMDLFGNYVPFCYDSKQMKVVSRNQKIGTSKIYIPCLTDRETYFYAAGYDRYNVNGSVFLYSKTINEDVLYQQKYGFKVPQKSKYVRLQYKFFIVEYIPITRDKARVRLASKVDMKLNYLPQFIVNMSARKFAFDYFKNIIKVNKKFKGSEWQKKIKQNPEFYKFFKKRIDIYLGKK